MFGLDLRQNHKIQDASSHYSAQDDQWQIFLVAAIITLLLNALMFVGVDRLLFAGSSDTNSDKEDTVELLLEPVDPKERSYVEANPEAPENEPDQTKNYSFRAQQSADEIPEASEKDDKPRVDGTEQIASKIIQGAVEESEPMTMESILVESSGGLSDRDNEEYQGSNNPRPMPELVLPSAPDFIEQSPEDEDGPGSSLEISGQGKETLDINQVIPLYQAEEVSDQTQTLSSSTGSQSNAKPLPRKRPTLPPDLVYGSLTSSQGSAERSGAIAIDSTFSQFGEYERQFYATVQAGWYQEIDFFQPIDTSARVIVQFRIRSDGTIDEVTVLNSTASELATWICQLALTKRSPFRPWTSEMVEVFGQERVIEISFSYL